MTWEGRGAGGGGGAAGCDVGVCFNEPAVGADALGRDGSGRVTAGVA